MSVTNLSGGNVRFCNNTNDEVEEGPAVVGGLQRWDEVTKVNGVEFFVVGVKGKARVL